MKKNLKIPEHIAFIMDGNGRWANKRGLPRNVGHQFGAKAIEIALKSCFEKGVKVVSVFAFSTENWNRPPEEVDKIIELVEEQLTKGLDYFLKTGVKVLFSGELDRVPPKLNKTISSILKKTNKCKNYIFNVCFNYGGRNEIVRAVNKIIKEGRTKKISEADFEKYLDNPDLPPPDIVVRTSGEKRISNFMLWEMAYSELYFPKIYWPSMNAKQVEKVIIEYNKRSRRFGNIY